MSRLGHATPTVALRYPHATAERDQDIAERLGALMRAAEQLPETASAAVVPIDR
jgi:hypothetical protein